MNTHSDFEDFFRLLESNGVEYMIVGGYAVAFHGYPRFTKDVDVFFDATPANADRLRAALVEFGFQPATVSDDVLLKPDAVVAIGLEPVRIDLPGSIDGVTFAEARQATVRGRYGGIEVNFRGRADLIRNKRASGTNGPRAGSAISATSKSCSRRARTFATDHLVDVAA
jgi:hypothetical protein